MQLLGLVSLVLASRIAIVAIKTFVNVVTVAIDAFTKHQNLKLSLNDTKSSDRPDTITALAKLEQPKLPRVIRVFLRFFLRRPPNPYPGSHGPGGDGSPSPRS
jgi:hypothetical protein